jgi:hypothetical protein
MCALTIKISQNLGLGCFNQPFIGHLVFSNMGNALMPGAWDDDDLDATRVECFLGLVAAGTILPGARDDDLDLTRVWQVV